MAPASTVKLPKGKAQVPAPHGVKGRLTAKVGPLPVYGWILLIAAGYLAYRHFNSDNSAASSSGGSPLTPDSQTSAGEVGGGASDGGAAGGGGTASPEAPGTDGGLLPTLLQQQLPAGTTDQGEAPIGYTANPAASDPVMQQRNINAPLSAPLEPLHPYATPAAATNFAASAQQATARAAAVGAAAPFGGVVGTKKLANGSTVTTYASGRQVQQVPGKSAYVIHA